MEIITAFVAGFLAMSTAVLAWRLKQIDDQSAREHSFLSEKRATLSPVYKDANMLFQRIVMATLRNESPGTIFDDYVDVSARIHLWAPDNIRATFEDAYEKWQKWAEIHLILIHGESLPENKSGAAPMRKPASEVSDATLNIAKRDFTSAVKKLTLEMRTDLEVKNQ